MTIVCQCVKVRKMSWYDLDKLTRQRVETAALKAVPLFDLFRFTYGRGITSRGKIPTFGQIRKTITSLLEELEGEGQIRTGRLGVDRRRVEGEVYTTVFFELEEWCE